MPAADGLFSRTRRSYVSVWPQTSGSFQTGNHDIWQGPAHHPGKQRVRRIRPTLRAYGSWSLVLLLFGYLTILGEVQILVCTILHSYSPRLTCFAFPYDCHAQSCRTTSVSSSALTTISSLPLQSIRPSFL